MLGSHVKPSSTTPHLHTEVTQTPTAHLIKHSVRQQTACSLRFLFDFSWDEREIFEMTVSSPAGFLCLTCSAPFIIFCLQSFSQGLKTHYSHKLMWLPVLNNTPQWRFLGFHLFLNHTVMFKWSLRN